MTVAIIGAGASGILAARALRRRCPGLELVMIDDREPGGVAYREPEPWHLLNSRAGVMGADDPGDFAVWAGLHEAAGPPGPISRDGSTGRDGNAYVPRRLFGDYLRAVLADTSVDLRTGRAVRITRAPGGLTVHLADGLPIRATDVVLALGPPRTTVPAFIAGHPELIGDPWRPGALDVIDPRRPVVIAGTGLTAVDTALTLLRRDRTAPITMVSRHGLLPLSHAAPDDGAATRAACDPATRLGHDPTTPAPLDPATRSACDPTGRAALDPATRTACDPIDRAGWDAVTPAGSDPARAVGEVVARARSLRSLVRGIREVADRHPDGWRPVVEAVRQHTNRLWLTATDADRERFLRHCARHWDVHRHRMAAPVAAEIARHRRDGALLVRTPMAVDRVNAQVVNATGPGRLPHAADPLTASLIADGLVRVGPFGLGLDVGPDGRAAGGPLWVVGPLCRGRLWETTAVPEIREQAAGLAESLGRAYTSNVAA